MEVTEFGKQGGMNMKKVWLRLFSWLLCLSLLMGYGVLAADTMPMDGMGPPPEP